MVGVRTLSPGPVPAPAAQVQPHQRVSLRPVGTTDADPSWLVEHGEREEQAQRLARYSIELASRSDTDDIGDVALELMRAGNHDPATLQHALVVCRSLSRDDPKDQPVKRAIRLLRHVTAFLGVPPSLYDALHLPAPAAARAPATAGTGL
jgi:hypothetical protein